MLSIFRTNQFFANILLFFYAAFLRLSLFIVPSEWASTSKGVWSNWVFHKIEMPSIQASILVILLVSIQGILINYIVNKYRMLKNVSLFPGAIYILLTSLIPDFLYLSPILMGTTFWIIALYQLFEVYKKYSCADNIYNVGFFTAVASLFYFSFSIFLLFVLFALSILRAFKVKESLMLLIGFITPYFLTFTYYYWNDKEAFFLQKQIYNNIAFLDFIPTDRFTLYIAAGLFSFLLLLTIFNYRSYGFRKNIRVQKNVDVLFIALMASVFTLSIQAGISIPHLLLLAVPLAVFLAISLEKMSPQMAEVVHLLLLVLALGWQFLPLLPV